MTLRPQIIGGLDKFSNRIAIRLMDVRSGSLSANAHTSLVDFSQEAYAQTFKRTLASLRESLKTHNIVQEPRVVVLAAAFDSQNTDGLDRLIDISQVLKVALPGAQAISLIVLFPPSIADDAEKIATYRFFVKLEQLVFNVPYLNTIFVNQIPQSMDESNVDDWSQEDVLFELLLRQVLDVDLDNSIQAIGAKAIANRTRTAGRNGCYSTSGAYELIYYPDECLRYLSARLQKDLFEKHLWNTQAIEADEETVHQIQRQSDQFILSMVETHNHAYKLIDLKEPIRWEPATSYEELKGLSKSLKSQVNGIVYSMPNLHDKNGSDQSATQEAFCNFLTNSPGYYAGATLYLQSLSGKRLPEGEAKESNQAAGGDLFQEQFFLAPFYAAVDQFFVSYLEKKGLSPQLDNDRSPKIQQFLKAIENINFHEEANEEIHIVELTRVCLQKLENLVNRQRIRLKDACRMSDELLESLLNCGGQIDDLTRKIKDEQQTAEETFSAFEKKLGFWGRTFSERKLFIAEKERLKMLQEEHALALDKLSRQFKAIQEFIFDLFNAVIVTSIRRAFINQAFLNEVDVTINKFNKYLTEVQNGIHNRWHAASRYTQIKTALAETVLSDTILGRLYAQIVSDASVSIEHSLNWLPSSLSVKEKQKLTYGQCGTTTDHYIAGSNTLIERLRDFSNYRVEPVGHKNILDILEITGSEQTYQTFKRCLDQLDRFLDFSPGLMPLMYESNRFQKVTILRSAGSLNKRLKSDYSDLFNSETTWVNNGDQNKIDMSCLTFGLPAFVIHGLAECRELFLSQDPPEFIDLWPQK